MPHRLYSKAHPILSAFLAPWQRVEDAGLSGKAWALVWMALQAIWNDLFVWLLCVLVVAHAADWYFGRKAAEAREAFDESISAWGLQSKIASLVQVGLVRWVELTLTNFAVADTQGMFAVAAVAALIYQDVESIESHRVELGGRPAPVISHVLDALRKVTSIVNPTKDDGSEAPRDRGR